jgi:hypothetical protein
MLSFNEGSFQAHWLDGFDLFRSRAALEVGTLRQQINVLRRTAPERLSFSVFDHFVFVGLYRLFSEDLRCAGDGWAGALRGMILNVDSDKPANLPEHPG